MRAPVRAGSPMRRRWRGSSLGAWVNVVLHLRALDRRIGAVLGRSEWRATGATLGAALTAASAGAGIAALADTWGPIPRALVSLGIFGVVYGGITLALKHPDATRLWKFVN